MNIGFLMLTDYSEAVNGKLYLTGGGWNVLRLPEMPHEWSFHIGLGIDVAWHETNSPHELVVTIQDPDGVELGEGLTANFETGRPPGMPQGQEQRLVMSIAAIATFTTAGPHAAVVEVNGEEIGRARFYLMEGVPEEGGGSRRPRSFGSGHAWSALPSPFPCPGELASPQVPSRRPN